MKQSLIENIRDLEIAVENLRRFKALNPDQFQKIVEEITDDGTEGREGRNKS